MKMRVVYCHNWVRSGNLEYLVLIMVEAAVQPVLASQGTGVFTNTCLPAWNMSVQYMATNPCWFAFINVQENGSPSSFPGQSPWPKCNSTHDQMILLSIKVAQTGHLANSDCMGLTTESTGCKYLITQPQSLCIQLTVIDQGSSAWCRRQVINTLVWLSVAWHLQIQRPTCSRWWNGRSMEHHMDVHRYACLCFAWNTCMSP